MSIKSKARRCGIAGYFDIFWDLRSGKGGLKLYSWKNYFVPKAQRYGIEYHKNFAEKTPSAIIS